MKKYNVVLMFIDDLGIGDVSCYNENSKIKTECMDQLAKEGMKFTNAHTTSALCTPSRYGLLTGRYNWRSTLKRLVYVASEDNLIEEGRMTLASFLKGQGYRTACIGKWHLGMRWEHTGPGPFDVDYSVPYTQGPNDCGFDYFYGIQSSLGQAPYVFLENDHAVSVPDTMSGWDNMVLFDTKTIHQWRRGPAASDYDVTKCCSILHEKALAQIDEFAKSDEPFFLYYPTPAVHVPILPSEEFQGKSEIGPYGDFVLMADAMLGDIQKKIKEHDLEENTILILASDNGCAYNVDFPRLISLGHNPSYIYRGAKGDIYEGGHRVPYIVKAPGIVQENTECGELVSLADILATFADYFDEKLPDDAGEDSVSNLALWYGDMTPVRKDIVYSSKDGALSIQKGPWKLEMCPGSGGPFDTIYGLDSVKCSQFQLYNVEGDITERWNVIEQHPDIALELKELLIKYIKDGRSTEGKPQKNSGKCHDYWKEIDWIRNN